MEIIITRNAGKIQARARATSRGRVFEITREGETVWDFYNPERQADGRRASSYRMTRITDPHLESVMFGNLEEGAQESAEP